jgi:soluble lytic murein transglycosylase-like protein
MIHNIVLTMLVTYSAPGSVPAKELATEIQKASTYYKLDPTLLTKIVLQESRGIASAHNAKSHDHGLMQINQKTAVGLGITPKCLYNWKCNLNAGAAILAQYKKLKGFKPCHYNTGPSGATKNGGKKCMAYAKALSKYRE